MWLLSAVVPKIGYYSLYKYISREKCCYPHLALAFRFKARILQQTARGQIGHSITGPNEERSHSAKAQPHALALSLPRAQALGY